MRDPLHEAGFDHPCRDTCSGWRQGYDRGFDVASEQWKPKYDALHNVSNDLIAELRREIDELWETKEQAKTVITIAELELKLALEVGHNDLTLKISRLECQDWLRKHGGQA